MGMSVKEQLEYCNEVFKKQAQSINMRRENAKYNDHYLEIVNTFNSEVYDYFADSKLDENSLTQCMQPMWYRLYLEKKRLQKLGLKKIYSRKHPVQQQTNQSGVELLTLIYKDDGKNTICEVIDKDNSVEKFYYLDNKNNKSRNFWGKKRRDYMITSSKFRALDECSCPNCGAYMKVEQLIDGCDYCHTKFTLEDLKGKISSLYEKNSNAKSKRGAPITLIVLSAVCFIIPVFIPLGILLMLIAMYQVKNNGQKTTESLRKLRKQFNLISEESLFSEIENKLFTLHYCDNEQDREALCDCELGVNYENVLVCDTEKYFIENVTFTPDNKFVSANWRFHLNVTYIQNEIIKQRKEIVNFKTIRSVKSIAEIKPDFLSYQCESCGSSLSLLNGGRCEYCGSKISLENFDWKVVEYKSDWKNI